MGVKRSGGLSAKISRMTAEMTRAVGPAVYAVAGNIQTDAQISLSTGAVSGKNHAPSAPGTPPNTDTGALSASIEVEHVAPLHARVVVRSPYGAIQELGGATGRATLPERPYMRPAAAKNRVSGQKLMRAAVDRVLRGGTLT
jgi:phage gpG-like protein